MQWKSGRVASHFFASLLVVGLAGCRPTPTPIDVPPAPHRGVHVRLACPNEATASLLLGPGRAWALRQGATLDVVYYDPSHEAGPQDAGSADAWAIAPAELPRWAAADRLAALPEASTARDNPLAWPDLLPTYREQLLLWEGTPYGLPLVGESPLCCYRLDLFADPVEQEAFRKAFGRPLDVPATWEQFAELAEHFRHRGPSLPPLPAADADLDRLFYTVAAGYARRAVPADEARRDEQRDDVFSFHYDLKTGRPRIAGPGFVHALRLLRRLQACRPAGTADHPAEAFGAGRAVLCLADAPWLKTFRQAALRDKVGVCRLPGGERYFDYAKGKAHPTPSGNRVAYLGGAGWLGVVPRSAEHGAAAFDLLADLAGSKTSMQIFLGENSDGGPVRAEQLYRERWDAFDLNATQTLRLREALQESLLHRGLKNPALCLRTPRQAARRAALVKAVRDVLENGADAEKALQAVALAWERLDREQGLAAHQADYRRSVGLLAK